MAVLLPKIAIGILEERGADSVKPLILAMCGYFAAAGLLAFFSGMFNQIVKAANTRIRLRYISNMCRKLQTMDYPYVENAAFYEKYDKAMNSCNTNGSGVEGVYNHLSLLPAKVITILGMMVMACTLSPVLLVLLVLHVLVTMWAARQTHNYRYAKKEELAKARRKITYYKNTTNDFTFGKDIRIFNFRDRIISNYKSEIAAYTSLNQEIANKEYLYGFAGLATLLLTNMAMYGILILKTYQGMPISSFSMYVSLITALMALMLEVGEYLSFIQNEGQYVDDYFHLMDAVLVEEGKKEEKPDSVEIVFDHVTFRYPNTDKDIFKDFSFTIHRGERLAVVGVNGAGKSTLVKLICGLYAPTEGHIYINGTDIREYSKKALYELYGTVFQDFNILAFTIRENVACTSEQVDETKVMVALTSVGLGDKVKNFDQGIDQMMLKIIDENGTDFSGGERQKLAIARALYKDAPMVIMDEPTAALDALAEAEIYEKFNSLVEDKTAIYISHRMSSSVFCDRILIIDGGTVSDFDTHENLMKKTDSLYYKLFHSQAENYKLA